MAFEQYSDICLDIVWLPIVLKNFFTDQIFETGYEKNQTHLSVKPELVVPCKGKQLDSLTSICLL